jgi:putative PIN family toxin of toxin-antitoxin system
VLIVNRRLLFELETVREKFRRYISFADVLGYVVWLHEHAETGLVPVEFPSYTADPDDDYLVALALSSGADFLVSGDRHLLELGDDAPVRVLTPRRFLEELERSG